MVFVLLAIDVVILAVWQIVDPLQVGVKDLLERASNYYCILFTVGARHYQLLEEISR